MLQSQLFSKTSRQVSQDETTVNARLLTQAGYVDKLFAGVYSYLPLGLRVLRRIEQVVRREMDAIGGQEILMPVLHPKQIWETTGGWDSIDVLFKLTSRTDKEYALGQSEEEVVTPLVKKQLATYKDLPLAVYQIHWKYRDELRSKSGLLRGREFFMKDMYSFHITQDDFERFYEVVKRAYLKIFAQLGLTAKATEASGGSFSQKISYEFMVLTDAGEDDIFYCDSCDFCVNVEIAKVKSGDNCPKCSKGKMKQARAAEVGNVFDLGQKYTKDFGLSVLGPQNEKIYPTMGCYGIGISRLMGVIVEKCHDDKGIIWPAAAAPFLVHILNLGKAADVSARALKLTDDLTKLGVAVLYDDRAESAGVKLKDADLIGLPWRVVISSKTGDKVELKQRSVDKPELVTVTQLMNKFSVQQN